MHTPIDRRSKHFVLFATITAIIHKSIWTPNNTTRCNPCLTSQSTQGSNLTNETVNEFKLQQIIKLVMQIEEFGA